MVKAGERAYIVEQGNVARTSDSPAGARSVALRGSRREGDFVSILLACPTRQHGSSGKQGLRRLDEAYPEQAPTLERVTREVQDELRRRLGGRFTLDELVDLYDEGTGWCTDLAVEVAPDEPFAWDARVVADAAFGRYQRAATDYAGGGRRIGCRVRPRVGRRAGGWKRGGYVDQLYWSACGCRCRRCGCSRSSWRTRASRATGCS